MDRKDHGGRWKLPITRAAVVVLRDAAGGPLHYRVLTSRMLERDLIVSRSSRVERTVYSNLSKHIRERRSDSWFRRTAPGMYALTEAGWNVEVWRSRWMKGDQPLPALKPQCRSDLTWLEAAELVLDSAERPMRAKELVERIWEMGLRPRIDTAWPYRHLRNELARSIREARSGDAPPRFIRCGPGAYGLARWRRSS